ncbi:MAG: C1 family peptidase [Bdellovibrionaceae bacterium]|nr:C1 family peptidase [Pseudobdellovibrionaceae bacterium]NUM57732.1 hypothetical protein [Pseudobdellovibrionaceae bacterium]
MKITILVFMLAMLTWGKEIDVKAINKAIEQTSQNTKALNQNSWYAKENWLTSLTEKQLRQMFNLEVDDKLVEFQEIDVLEKANVRPSKWDWRDVAGKNWVSPVKNQGVCGSCVAFAAVATLETQINVTAVNPFLNLQLSPQHLFSCGGGKCSYGWRPEPAAKFLKKTGVVDEACMPYISGAQGDDQACQSRCQDSDSRVVKIIDFERPTWFFKNKEKVKKALLKGPLVTTMKVYEDFLAYSHGVYKHVKGPALGGHAISLVGYDDEKQAFLIRNSWGDSWGEKGFGYISYEDISGIGNQTWLYEVPTSSKYLVLEYPRNQDILSQNIKFKLTTSGLKETESLNYTIKDLSSRSLELKTLTSRLNEDVELDTTTLKDGKYEVVITSRDEQGRITLTSRPHVFYILNQQPVVDVSFKFKNTQSLNVLSGRVEVQIQARSQSVPLTDIEFHFKNAEGYEVVRQTKSQSEVMDLTWATGQLKNGKYEVWVVGKIQTEKLKYQFQSPSVFVQVNNP